jgi:NDP-sugar pyrophosphorylase family protein
MGAMTEEIPKPMLPIHGRPMLEYILEHLAATGITQFLIVIGYYGDVIRAHFENTKSDEPAFLSEAKTQSDEPAFLSEAKTQSDEPAFLSEAKTQQVQFVWQNPVNGTGSGALLAQTFAAHEPFLLTYGDILCDPVEYRRAAQILFEEPEIAAVVAVKAVDDPWQGAAVYAENGRISRILEKPPKGTSTTRWNSAGFYAFRPVVFDYLAQLQPSPRGEYELTTALDIMRSDGLDLRISPIEGPWRDVGRPEDLAAARSEPPL